MRKRSSMTIRIEVAVRAQETAIPPGTYQVSVEEDLEQVVLTGESSSFSLEAFRRSSKVAVSKLKAQLRSVGGEARSLLVVRTPPATEWVVSLVHMNT